MKIKFLRDCQAPQVYEREFCECCGPERMPAEPTDFFKDQEENPNEYNHEIDLKNLKYNQDYIITEYP